MPPRTGIVVKRTRSHCYVESGDDAPRLCRVRSTLFHKTDGDSRIAVGDEVVFDSDASEDAGWIREILPRRTALTRQSADGSLPQVLVSNADQLLIITSIKRPSFRYGVVDRLLVAGLRGGLVPALVLNKTDLAEAGETEPISQLYQSIGYSVWLTSVQDNSGLQPIRDMLSSKVTVLCGHSGVGKSSLIKTLYPQWTIRIGEVNRKKGKGRHTTNMAQMYMLPEGGYIVDTPGIRELMPYSVPPGELERYFIEFESHRLQCRFKGCSHLREPDCRVREAVDSGAISIRRYESYRSLYDSLPKVQG